MNTNSQEYQQAVKLGTSLVGKKAYSRLLTEISSNGNKVMCAPQLITGFEVVKEFQEPSLMVIIGGKSVYEDTLINIH